MTDAEIVKALEGTKLAGFEATYEYPGFMAFWHPACGVEVLFTSDHSKRGTIQIDAQTHDGAYTTGIGELSWHPADRTLLAFCALAAPFLVLALEKYPRRWLEIGGGIPLTSIDIEKWQIVGHCAHGHEMRVDPENRDCAVDLGCDTELTPHEPNTLKPWSDAP